jgi:hypothetical protein
MRDLSVLWIALSLVTACVDARSASPEDTAAVDAGSTVPDGPATPDQPDDPQAPDASHAAHTDPKPAPAADGGKHDASAPDARGQPAADGGKPAPAAAPDAASAHPADATPDASAEPPTPSDAGAQAPETLDASTPIDAGPVVPDAGQTPETPDAGSSFDAGSNPALDAGAPDAALPSDASTPDAATPPEDAGEPCAGPPGLYKDAYCQVLSDGIERFTPRYPLWSDGAKKDRFIYLPAGTRIDTSNPDRFSFPVGTRLYKTFAAGDLRVETRVLSKVSSGVGFDRWSVLSYAWSADQHSVSAAPSGGVTNALGSGLDIPSQANCKSCHNMTGADAVIGFNALQLNHDDGGLALADLLLRGSLVNGSSGTPANVSLSNAVFPGNAQARAALGYLHGNCGHCHGGPTPRAEQRLWSVLGMTDLQDAPIMESAVCQCLQLWRGRQNDAGSFYTLRVSPGRAELSGIIGRMSSRIRGEQMPPVGTNHIDPTGLATVRAWIDSLDSSSCDAAPPRCPTP